MSGRAPGLLLALLLLGCGADRGGRASGAACAGQPGCPPLAITDVRVIPMTDAGPAAVQDGRTVLVRDGRILRVAPADSVALPPETVEVAGGGRYLVPGLADLHVHLEWAGRSSDLLLYLLQGVTTVRHMDGRPRELGWRDSVAAGHLLGPTIHMAGPVIDGEDRGYELTAVATTPAEARSVVAAQDSQGYDFVKVYDDLRPEVFRAVMEEAARRGLRVAGHVPDRVGLRDALRAGLGSVEHLNGFGGVADAAASSGAAAWPEHHVAGTLDRARLEEAVRWTRQSGAAVVPTLSVYRRHVPPGEMRRALVSDEMAWAPPYTLEAWGYMYYATAFQPPEAFAAQERAAENRRAVVRALHEAGVPVLAGTDAPIPLVVPGLALHRELELLVDGGLSPAEALRASTSAAADFLGETATFGVVAEGARADLLLLDENPLADVSNTRSLHALVARGRWIGPERLGALRDSVRRANRSLGPRASALEPLAGPGRKLVERSFVTHFAGRPVGAERFALFETAGGDTVLVGRQVPSDPLDPALRLTAEKRAGGPWWRLELREEAEGGRRAELRRADGRLILSGSDGDGDTVADTVSAEGVHVLRGPGLSGAVPLAMHAGADAPGVVASVELDPEVAVRRLEATVGGETDASDCAPASAGRTLRVQLGSGPFGEELTIPLAADGLPAATGWQIPAGTFRAWPADDALPTTCASTPERSASDE